MDRNLTSPRKRAGSASFAGKLLIVVVSGALLLGARPALALNAIQIENALPGNPASQWDISGAGDASIQGFATTISVNRGGTIRFKIKTDASAYHIDVYRLGWYGGNGARLQPGAGVVTATLPQTQPLPLTDTATGLVDCGNWGESAHWDVPAGAVSGIYIARLERDDTHGASHIAFIVRDDGSTSSLFFKTSDCTWQAYNVYGGNSLYTGTAPFPAGHAAKVSYNRPFSTRAGGGGGGASEDWLFNAEYPMVRWLESNGYDMSYTTDLDTDRDPSQVLLHHVFMSVGHDEYWSAGERTAVEAARSAGVHLAFFSGNEIYWKTRWEPSIDGSNTDHRTLVCYKEGTLGENVTGVKSDPLTGTWTGLWRDGCAYVPPTDGCRPENALSGQISWVGSTDAIQVPDTYKNLRFWRNTAVASLGSGATLTLTPGTLGYEWDFEQYPASYPSGRIKMSSTTNSSQVHHLSLYRAPSGALVFGAGTVQWSWGLDGTHDRGSDPPSLAMQQATVNLFADMGVQPGALQPGLVAASASTDTQAPTSVITAPLTGASFPSGVSVTISGTAAEVGGGVLVGVEVSTDGGGTWHPATGTTSWSYTWTPSTVGAVTLMSRGFDDSGNMEGTTGEGLPNVVSVAVTPAVCPCTVFQPTDTPGGEFNDGGAINVGMKFRTTADGFITGARFYKGPANTGTHTGLLWSGTGALLAQAVFTGESASGWQEVGFSPPVAVTAGTTYIVAYLSSGGGYAANDTYFTSAVVNGPLRGLAFGEDGPNGVYVAAATPTFPTSSFMTSNYWVDVVFNTSVGPDLTPPTVTALSPTNGASAVSVNTAVTATFSEALNAATVTGSTMQLTGPGATPVAGTVLYLSATRSAQFVPSVPLAYSTSYTATLTGGAGGIADLSNNVLAANVSWTFTTSAPPPPPPTEGPGGPILVISSAANPFSRYPVEILRAEGFNAFTAMDLSLVTPAVLASYDVVVLGQGPLSASDVTMLGDWTNNGGTLIAFRPDAQLAPLLGLTPVGGTLSNAYLLVNTASGPGVGIVSQTMQFHGDADLYTLSGATAVATLYSNATTATPNPAVTTNSVGSQGGRAMAFTYDLARSIVYTRQGNPAWAGTKRDGQIEPIRSDDMYFGNAAGDPQPDWVDFNKIAIPQADEQQRLLANAIIQGDLHRKPLPRFWYLPKGLKAAIVMTGDNHGDSGMAPRFDIYRNQSTPGCSVDDWECVRATGYLYLGSAFTSAQATMYKNLGFEVSLHINTNCARFTPSEYENYVSTQMAAFAAKYPDIPLVTNRNHCISFPDWSTTPEIEAEHGIRFDTNYYYWPAAWIQDRPGMFTGSGMPMRFAKLDGTLIDCYQATTQMPDESGESFPAFCNTLLDRATGPEGYYGVFTTNMHFDSSPHPGSDAVVASAQAHGVPVVSSQQMLTWLDGRNGSSFGGLTWSGNQLNFSIVAGAGSRNLQAMVPLISAAGPLSQIRLGGSPVTFTTQTIKGIQYAFFPAAAGNYVADYAPDTTPPVISAVAAVPHDDGTATVTWTTNEASDSRVDFGTAQGSLAFNANDATLVTSHTVTLSGLAASTIYYYRITSKDATNNSATEPIVTSDPLSFTTPASVCFRDQVTSDFAAGTTGTGTSVATIADGDVTLRAAAAAEFTVMPPTTEWQSFPWSAGGASTVAGGLLTVDGARFNTEPSTTTYGPGTSVEFVATFSAARHQYIGFGGGDDSGTGMFNSAPWAMFGTGAAGSSVLARVNVTGTLLDFTIPGSLLGAAHKYRVDWKSTSVDFWVDDVLVHTETASVPAPMRVAISDFDPGGLTVTVDWIHVTPYAASGSFTSRVFDGSAITTWGQMSWSASVPGGTTLQMFEHQGNTPSPDGSWTAYVAIPSSGTSLGGSSRYIQYRADLATTVPTATPVLQDVHVTCNASPDVTPPVISSVTSSPGGGGATATIGWTTDELATSRVDYGTSQNSLVLNSSSGALVGSHALTLSGLTPTTTYYYRVTSADAASNTTTEPVLANPPLSFTTLTAPCVVDRTSTDFAAGTPGAATHVSETGDGEVILNPTEGAEFSGAALPAGWSSTTYAGGGTAVVGGGHVSLDAAYVAPATTYGAGRTVEFVATFDATAMGQHAGFGTDLNAAPWAIFSTDNGGVLEARTNPGSETNQVIPGSWLGAPHRFRIDWNTNSVVYSIDGVPVASHALTIATPMRPIGSDGPLGGNPFQLDWIRMTPYTASGSYTSRVFDSGGSTTWGAASWTSSLPAATALAMLARVGNTATPDGSWTAFTAIASSGSSVGTSGRYLQYRADLSTADATVTPELRDVSIVCTTAADVTPPVITNVVTASAGDGLSASVTWTTDEQSTSRVDFGTSSGSLTLNAASATLVTSHGVTLSGLTPGTTYYYRVMSVDAFGNTATQPTSPATSSFATQAPPCAVDVTSANFAGGTTTGTYVSETTDGEVILQPAAGTEFSGSTLSAGWTSGPWAGGGTATVGGGLITVDGAHVSTVSNFAPGGTLEFVATFQAANFQNVGFAADGAFTAPWVTIGEGNSTGGVYARRDDGADVLLSATALGAPHRYRIDWTATAFVFYVDGVQVTTMTKAVGTNMVPILSDFNVGAPALSVDWLRLTPYAASGSYTSRVFDSGGVTTWGAANWTSSLPAGTSLAMSARRGATPVPDGSWTSYIALPSPGSSVAGGGRYLQYRADLATTDGTATPELRDVSIQCVSTPDVTPPVISSVVATPAGDGQSASVTWTTDEPANSRVDYGTSPLALTLNVSGGSLVTAHALTLSGLATGTTYYYRVTSADASTNSASSPTPPAVASFFTPAPCPSDQTAANFGLGTLDANTAVSLIGDGEIILKPASGTEFSGTTLPGDWQSATWAAGGAITVGSGALTVDGAHASTNASFGPGRSLEFVATYTAATFQNVGFAGDASFGNPWVVIGEGSATDGVYARTNGGASTLLSNTVLGSPHRYRIDWNATNFVFWVDGVQKATITLTVATNMVAMVSDLNVAGGALSVDWLRVSPYASSGSFTSRVFDQGGATNWGIATIASSTPTGTSLSVLARTGNTATPDGSWSSFVPLTNGVALAGNSRYLQYRADLATSLPGWTPELQGLAIDCVPGPDVTAPVISNVAAAPALDGLSASVTWTTDEVSNSRVDYGTNSGSLSSNASSGSMVKSHAVTLTGLSPLVTYYYRVTSADAASNGSTSPMAPSVLSFTTPALACFVDQTEADFTQGTLSNTYVSATADGEVIGAPTLGSEFSGTTLASGWTSVLWSNGAAGGSTVAGGSVNVDGGRLTPTSTTGFGPGRVLEFVATFAAATANQHVGFGSGDNTIGGTGMFNNNPASWAMFSTKGGGSVQARLNIANAASDVDLGVSYLGSPHLYRIEWKASPDSIIWLIDGASVRRAPAVIAAAMRPGASDFTAGGAVLSIDWLRMSPYASSGSFVSRVYDGTGSTAWGAMTWTATVPGGTSLALSVRKGNTPTPDGTWTAFTPVPTSGSSVGGIARYIQYSAQLTASADLTPALKDVSITCTPCTGPAPAAITDLAVSRQSSGGATGRLPITVTFTADAGATATEVYRAPFGGYPRYDEGGGVMPTTPAYPPPAPWTLTTVTASGQSDLPPTRDQWHYVAFSRNACGTVSAVSNRPTGVLDYKLGDVSDGVAVCSGDNVVGTGDISLLGAHYGETITGNEDYACLDVGPTSDGYVTGRPTTDRQIEFEDLVMFALEYGVGGGGAITASAQPAQPALAATDALRLEAPAHVRAGQTFDVAVHMDGAGRLQGVSVQLDWDEAIARPLGMTSGGWLEGQSGVVYSARPGRADAALLGKRSTGIAGSGTLAVFSFRALADGEPALAVASVQARDGSNRAVTLDGVATAPQRPTVTAFDRIVPNPFAGRASVRFSLAQEGPVDLSIYSVDGRRVRTLVRGTLPAGTHAFEWDRSNDQGTRMEPGLYLVRLTTAQGRFTHKLTMIQ